MRAPLRLGLPPTRGTATIANCAGSWRDGRWRMCWRWLLISACGNRIWRSIEEQPEYAYYLSYAPTGKDTLETLVRVAGQRWQIEQCFETAKGECGLDHYEVRHWQGWYRHITLAMLAHAVLSVLRARGEKNSKRASAAQR